MRTGPFPWRPYGSPLFEANRNLNVARPEERIALYRSRFICLLLFLHTVSLPAQTRLEQRAGQLDSLQHASSLVKNQLDNLNTSIHTGKAKLEAVAQRLEKLDLLLIQLDRERRLLRADLEDRALAKVQSELQLNSIAQQLDSLETRRERLGREVAQLARRLFPLRHLDANLLLWSDSERREGDRARRMAKGLAQPIADKHRQLGELLEFSRQKQAEEARLLEEHQTSLKLLEKRNREQESNRRNSLSRQQELGRDQELEQALLVKMGLEQEAARRQEEKLSKATAGIADEVKDLRKRWEKLAGQREEEALRLDALNRKLQTGPAASKESREVSRPPVSTSGALVRGQLGSPVKGRVVRGYGRIRDPLTGSELDNPGIDYTCSTAATIQSVASGSVERVTWISGFGSTVLLRHGQEDWTVYARLSEVQVQEGQTLEAGAAIGKAGGDANTQLHFELWHKGQSQNPAGWFR